MSKAISEATAKLALQLVDVKIDSEKDGLSVEDLAPLFTARGELAALVGGITAPKKGRTPRGSKRGLPKEEERPEA